MFSQLVRCINKLYRLKILDDQAWDETGLPVDSLLILDRVINNMDQVAILAGLDNTDSPEGDIFLHLAQMLRSLRPGWDSRLRLDNLVLLTSPTQQKIDKISLPDSLGVENLDNDWLMDLFPWEIGVLK